MSRLLIIRHAETDMAGTFCGHADPPVNERGRTQIETLLKTLSDHQIDAVYTSDLQRARTTAEALANALAAPLAIMPDLREINFGAWEGLTWNEIEASNTSYAKQWIEAHPDLPAPNGESFEAFHNRVTQAFEQLLIDTTDQHVALITHAGVMRVILQSLCGVDQQQAWELTKPYCSFFEYPYLKHSSGAQQ
jgi:alpha-ribazole phosphatase